MYSFREILIVCVASAGFIGGVLEGRWIVQALFRWFRSRRKKSAD